MRNAKCKRCESLCLYYFGNWWEKQLHCAVCNEVGLQRSRKQDACKAGCSFCSFISFVVSYWLIDHFNLSFQANSPQTIHSDGGHLPILLVLRPRQPVPVRGLPRLRPPIPRVRLHVLARRLQRRFRPLRPRCHSPPHNSAHRRRRPLAPLTLMLDCSSVDCSLTSVAYTICGYSSFLS